jgi:4-aminobutyrate aminotransferase/(S)-3-amino-2-methylpropionate transaminase
VKDQSTKEPAANEVKEVLATCHRRGLLIISAGTLGNVIRILVPLVATDSQVEEGLHILEESLATVHTADPRKPPSGPL